MLEPQHMTNSDAQCLGDLVGIKHSLLTKLKAKPNGQYHTMLLVTSWKSSVICNM